MGFLPRKQGKRRNTLKSLVNEQKTMVFYESPKRIRVLLKDLIESLGDRQGVLSREMTKRHEEFVRGNLSGILDVLAGRPEIKGECTLVVKGGAEQKTPDADALREEIIQGLHGDGLRLSGLVKNIAERYGLPKKQIYTEALKIKSLQDVMERDHVVSKGKK